MSTEVWIAALGIAGTAGSAIGASAVTIRGQRTNVREQFRVEKRADTYVRLFDYLLRERSRANLTGRVDTPTHWMPKDISEDEWWLMHAQVEAFASPRVRQLVDEFFDNRIAFMASRAVQRLAPMQDPGAAQQTNATADAAQERMGTLTTEILKAVRAELGQ